MPVLELDALIVDGGSDATAFAMASASAVDGEEDLFPSEMF